MLIATYFYLSLCVSCNAVKLARTNKALSEALPRLHPGSDTVSRSYTVQNGVATVNTETMYAELEAHILDRDQIGTS